MSSEDKREFVRLHPDVWADEYLPDFENGDDCAVGEDHDVMKQEIRSMLLKDTKDPCEKLKLIDIVQRLGISYHFKTEIEDQLTKLYDVNFENYHNNLYNVALHFRLLRQQGFRVSSDVFKKFKDNDEKFKETLSEDVDGLLSLYEASFLGIKGEDILDEAVDFTTEKLQLLLPNLSPNIAEEVAHALNRPIRKNLPRLEARHFIHIYEGDESHNQTLVQFAKSDFNMLQVLHQKELKDFIEIKLDGGAIGTSKKRCPIHEKDIGNFWIVGTYFEPQYSMGRKILTRITALFAIVNDTYDNYGQTDELEFLTEVIQRWDVGAIGSLPEYMQLVFKALNSVVDEIEEIGTREGKPFYTYYAKEFIKELARHYLTEAKWRDAKYVPTVEEYLAVCKLTSCYKLMAAVSFIGMGETATKEAFEWIYNNPKIVVASEIISRLMDDIVSHKFEQERDHVASAVECYMKQHNTSEEETIKMLRKYIENSWKDINEEFLRPVPVVSDLLERSLNLARVMDVYYKDVDGFSNPLHIKAIVASVLKDPIL